MVGYVNGVTELFTFQALKLVSGLVRGKWLNLHTELLNCLQSRLTGEFLVGIPVLSQSIPILANQTVRGVETLSLFTILNLNKITILIIPQVIPFFALSTTRARRRGILLVSLTIINSIKRH